MSPAQSLAFSSSAGHDRTGVPDTKRMQCKHIIRDSATRRQRIIPRCCGYIEKVAISLVRRIAAMGHGKRPGRADVLVNCTATIDCAALTDKLSKRCHGMLATVADNQHGQQPSGAVLWSNIVSVVLNELLKQQV